MRYPRRAAAARSHGTSRQDFWLSFSDLMSVLVLVFILILFYILYKYFVIYGAYQEELNKMLVIEAALDEKESELTSAQSALSTREEELSSAQTALSAREEELSSAQEELAKQQLMLNLAKQAVDDSEAELSAKQLELDEALQLITRREAEASALEEQVSAQQSRIEEQQQQLEALVGVRTRIIENLSDALVQNHISATVDPANGSIMLESDVLFEYGSDRLSDAGRRYIDQFLPVYLSVLFSEENEGFVSEIIIEGHTDTVDTYIKNLKLSQSRAYAVAEYVLDGANGHLTGAQKSQLKTLLTANGRSYSDPIMDENGMVDADASRRVVFKFRLTDEQMIEQMQKILENGSAE